MDPDVGRWVLEFLARKTTTIGSSDTDALIRKMVRVIPLSKSVYRSKKTALLKLLREDLSTATIEEDTLRKLEVLEELHRCVGSPVSASMRDAYCAVAVECTLKYLEVEASPSNNRAYLNAIERIWRGRVRCMEPSASGEGSLLFTEELKRWSADVEASLRDSKVRERLVNLNSRRDAIQKLRVCLAEAWEDLGPSSFLEVAASTASVTANRDDDAVPVHGHEVVLDASASPAQLHGVKDMNREPPIENRSTEAPIENQSGDAPIGNQCTDAPIGNQRGDAPIENQSGDAPIGNQCTDAPIGNQSGDAPIGNQSGDAPIGNQCADAPIENQSTDAPIENQGGDAPIGNRSADADFRERHVCQTINNIDGLTKATAACQSDVHRQSLMERNNTAQTYEWDESADGLEGGTSNHASKIHLPSPKGKKMSPLKKYEPQNIMMRRKRKKWSALEEETLRTAVNQHGEGNWKLILNSHRDIFAERTQVDLKDKWRNLTRYGAK